MNIYVCNAFEAKDMLTHLTPSPTVTVGEVGEDQFGKSVVRSGGGQLPVASGQYVNKALNHPLLDGVSKVIVFFGKRLVGGDEVVIPTEIAAYTEELGALARENLRKSTMKSLNLAQHFTEQNNWF